MSPSTFTFSSTLPPAPLLHSAILPWLERIRFPSHSRTVVLHRTLLLLQSYILFETARAAAIYRGVLARRWITANDIIAFYEIFLRAHFLISIILVKTLSKIGNEKDEFFMTKGVDSKNFHCPLWENINQQTWVLYLFYFLTCRIINQASLHNLYMISKFPSYMEIFHCLPKNVNIIDFIKRVGFHIFLISYFLYFLIKIDIFLISKKFSRKKYYHTFIF